MRISSWSVILGSCAFSYAAHADLPNTAPIYGGDPAPIHREESLDTIAAALEHSVPETDELRDEAERRLRHEGDVEALATGSAAASFGATLLAGGIALASSSSWQAPQCPTCLPAVLFIMGGTQLSVLSLFLLGSYGGPHRGRHHARRVDELVRAMSHPSIEAANAARRQRVAVGWSLLASGIVLAASSVTLFAIGHQDGFDDGVRMGIAGLNGFIGSWLTSLGGTELAAKWIPELALAPSHGAMIGMERRF